jgi:hypothetical protein
MRLGLRARFVVATAALVVFVLLCWRLFPRVERTRLHVDAAAHSTDSVARAIGTEPRTALDDSINRVPALSEAPSLLISVLSEQRAQVPGVAISEYDTATREHTSVGVTDRNGQWMCPSIGHPRVLLLSHPTYLSARIDVASAETGIRSVTLSMGARIEGVVINGSRQLGYSKAWVLAYPDRRPPSKIEVFERISRGFVAAVGEFALTRSNENGEFIVGPLVPGLSYSLIAGGNGCITPSPMQGILAGARDVHVDADDLFGVCVQYRDAKTTLPIVDRAYLWDHPGPMWSANADILTGIPTDTLQAIIAGLKPSQTSRQPGPEFVLLATPPKGADRPASARFFGSMIGYSAIDTMIQALPFGTELAIHVIELEPLILECGPVLVSLVGGFRSVEARLDRRVYDIGSIRFRTTVSDALQEFRWPLRELTTDTIFIPCVPCGRYDVSLSFNSGPRGVRADEGAQIEVSEAGCALHFQLGALSACNLLVHRNGKEYTGEVVVRVLSQAGGHTISNHFVFTGPPYLIDGLLPAEYGFKLERPFDSGPTRYHNLATEQDETGTASIVFVD